MNEETPIITPPVTPKPKVNLKWLITVVVLFVVIVGVFRVGYNAGKSGYSFSINEFKIVNKSGQPIEVDYSLLWEALDVVNHKYIDKDQIDQQKVLYGAIHGAIAAAGDDYTEFFDPETFAQFKTSLEGVFSGVGLEITKQEGNIVVVSPLDDTPAKRAGLLPKDIIVKINDESVLDWTTDQAARAIRGEAGTDVKLSIYREGRSDTFDVTLTRQKIEVKSVKVSYQQVNGKQVAIIKISRFGDDTKRLFDIAVNDIKSKGASAVVLDLRNNPGGYLTTSVELASDWLDQDVLVVEEVHSEKEKIDYTSLGSNRLGGLKTVVLINGGSASASEILAGALQDHGKAQLIGEKSFGKGSVQELIPISHDSAIKVTVAKWITPSGKNLNQGGLDPNIEVKNTEQDTAEGKDPQLDKALEEAVK